MTDNQNTPPTQGGSFPQGGSENPPYNAPYTPPGGSFTSPAAQSGQPVPTGQNGPYYPPGTHFPGQIQRSSAATTGLVLGIIAIVTSWIPLINWLSFILAITGLVFAVIGTIATVKGTKSGKGKAITSIVLNVLAIIVVIIVQILVLAVAKEITNDYYSGYYNSGKAETTTGEEPYDLTVGTSIEVDGGLTVTVDSIETLTSYDGSLVTGVQVTYVNNSSETQDYSPYSWKGEDTNGAQESGTALYIPIDGSDDNELFSGTLAVGGTKTGCLYFDEDIEKIVYFSSLFSDEPAASWLVD